MLLHLSCGKPPETAAAHFGSQPPQKPSCSCCIFHLCTNAAPRYKFQGGGGVAHSRTNLSARPSPSSPPSIHATTASVSGPESAAVAFLSPPPKKLFKLIFLGIYRTCISLVCVLSHSWPISTAVSRTCFRFILADCKFCIQTPPPPPSISTLT